MNWETLGHQQLALKQGKGLYGDPRDLEGPISWAPCHGLFSNDNKNCHIPVPSQ